MAQMFNSPTGPLYVVDIPGAGSIVVEKGANVVSLSIGPGASNASARASGIAKTVSDDQIAELFNFIKPIIDKYGKSVKEVWSTYNPEPVVVEDKEPVQKESETAVDKDKELPGLADHQAEIASPSETQAEKEPEVVLGGMKVVADSDLLTEMNANIDRMIEKKKAK